MFKEFGWYPVVLSINIAGVQWRLEWSAGWPSLQEPHDIVKPMRHGNWKEFHKAAVEGDFELVQFYVRSGIDVNYEHPEFMTTAPVSAILAGQEEIALFLVDSGADPTIVSSLDQLNPLQAAQQEGLIAVVEKIEASGG